MGAYVQGPSGKVVEVSDDNRMYVVNESPFEKAVKDGDAYSWSWSYNSTAADTVLAVRNDSTTRTLVIDKIAITSDAAGEFQIHHADICTTGTGITGRNLNLASGNVADATAIEDETANTQGNLLGEIAIEADYTFVLYDVNIRLGGDDVIGIDDLTGSTALTSGFIHGYFE